jgi:hypothetical protein
MARFGGHGNPKNAANIRIEGVVPSSLWVLKQ